MYPQQGYSTGACMINKIEISKQALKDLSKLPKYILDNFQEWLEAVEELGIEEVRKIKSFHDEPLHGMRAGQRSCRLNKAYRVIYIIIEDRIKFIKVIEVNKHEY